jgi:cytosine/uracil/thiamine/allantoin permease
MAQQSRAILKNTKMKQTFRTLIATVQRRYASATLNIPDFSNSACPVSDIQRVTLPRVTR